MADNEQQGFPQVEEQPQPDNTDNGADFTDPSEYDPSALNDTFSGFPREQSLPAVHDDAVSPTAASLHPLPPRPQPFSSSTASLPPKPTMSAQPQPRMRGGFEMDDDADEDEEERDDQDSVAVYEPNDGHAETYGLEQDMDDAESEAATPVQHDALDSTSKTPVQPNGLAHIPAHTNGVNVEASGSVPSPNATINALSPQRDSTATPMQSVTESVVEVAPASLLLNTWNTSNTAFAPAVPKGRLAHDVVGILEDRIKDDPRGDVLAWLELIEELKRRNKQDEVRQLYDRFFEVFPLAVCSPSQLSVTILTVLG
jgi:cleavage stimulation factor subunit 3